MWLAFDHLFMELAERDSRAIRAIDRDGVAETFVGRELFCVAPGCDCRRVVFQVHSVEQRSVVATVNYFFGRRRGNEPQLWLDSVQPQSERAKDILLLFADVVQSAPAFRETVRRHYRMWRAVVDDERHPDHARLRAFLEAEGVAPPVAGIERIVAKASKADDKLRRRFAKLVKKVDGLRQRVRVWRDSRPEIERRIALYEAQCQEHHRLRGEMTRLLDRAYASGALAKGERAKVSRLICEACEGLQAEHEDLKAIYNRHARRDFDKDEQTATAAQIAMMTEMLEMAGIDLRGEKVATLDELRDLAIAKADEQDEQAAARRAKRKKTAKQVAKAEQAAEAERNATKAVQQVYRALALALHPDRESDPVERERKTKLMGEVNVAYEASDLLRLLELQLELERVDPARATDLAEERLVHYLRVLDEQARRLTEELAMIEAPFSVNFEPSRLARSGPAIVLARLEYDLDEVRRVATELREDLATFQDVDRLRVWLKYVPRANARRKATAVDASADWFD